MISFFPKSLRAFTSLLIAGLAVGICATPAPLIAQPQTNGDLFQATWVAKSPEEGTIIILLKRNGRASYFWGENADRTVYQGTWTSDEESAKITWEDSSYHQLQREALGFSIAYTGGNGVKAYSSPAQQVPKELLGQWARPPKKDDDMLSDRDRAKGFFGIWEIDSENGTEFVFVESDRSAASTWSPEGQSSRGLRGSWAKQGAELHIAWNTGHYSILRQNERGFGYKRIDPGALINEDDSPFSPGNRTSESNIPADWLATYDAERELYSGGIAFSSRKMARNFYRGEWIVKHSANAFEKVELSRFGGLSTSRDRTLEGTWLMSGQDIFMRWDDGMRKILSPIADGFLLYEYKPGRPLDGVPTRIYAATPADPAKLAKHMEGRDEVARQMLEVAEAAGIKGSESQGWGRTFARWAWPFGASEDEESPEALLQDGYEAPSSSDPWWWPFWSEKRLVEQAPVTQSEEELTAGAEESSAAAETTEGANEDTVNADVNQAQAAADAVEAATEDAGANETPEPTAEEPTKDLEVAATEPKDEEQPENSNRPRKKGWYWPF